MGWLSSGGTDVLVSESDQTQRYTVYVTAGETTSETVYKRRITTKTYERRALTKAYAQAISADRRDTAATYPSPDGDPIINCYASRANEADGYTVTTVTEVKGTPEVDS